MSDSIQRLIEAAEAAEARLSQLEASKNKRPLTGPQPVDWREFAAMQKRLAQAESDRDVLAAEVEANRLVTAMAAKHENNGQRWNLACKARRLAVDATDKSGALERAKEAK
jgi:hypothetical protein